MPPSTIVVSVPPVATIPEPVEPPAALKIPNGISAMSYTLLAFPTILYELVPTQITDTAS
jgi:hypothetical protein